jgi:glycosyltransferase involved in cell wall biosynthesis
MAKIFIVIPAYNEEKVIGKVIFVFDFFGE